MFELKLDTDNAAFDGRESTETCAILRDVIKRLRDGELDGYVRDNNGNTVGHFSLNDMVNHD